MPEQATVYKLTEAEERARLQSAAATEHGERIRVSARNASTTLPPMTREEIARLFDEACWIVTGEEKFYPDFPDTPRPRPLASDAHLIALMHLIGLAGARLEGRR